MRPTRVLVPLLALTLVVPSSSGAELLQLPSDPGCRADPLVMCKAQRRRDTGARELGLDLEVVSPAAGLLPGSGSAKADVTMTGTYKVDRSAHGVQLDIPLSIDQAVARHDRPGAEAVFDSGSGTQGLIEASLSASMSGCGSSCSSRWRAVVVSTSCQQQRVNQTLGMSVVVRKANGRPLPEGSLRYAVTLKGAASLGKFPFGEPPASDTGTAKASIAARVGRPEVTLLDGDPPPRFTAISCFNPRGEQSQGTVTATTGAAVVAGRGFIKKGRSSTPFVIAAQAQGLAAGASGPFVPGWYEVVIDNFFSYRIRRGSLPAGDMAVSADGTKTTLRVSLPGFGRASIIFTKAGPSSASGAMGMSMAYGFGGRYESWSMDADMFDMQRSTVSGKVGSYRISGIGLDDRTPFAFRASAGSVRTCTNCPEAL